jgi:uncharacterized membrane protein YkvA (DUF1232 family)
MKDILDNGRLAWRLIRDERVPIWVRIGIPLVMVIYLIVPIDLIPDFIVGPGQLDDLAVILFGMNLIVRLAPAYVVDEHRRALGLDVDSQASGARGERAYWSTPPERTSQPPSAANGAIDGEYRIVTPESDQSQPGMQ